MNPLEISGLVKDYRGLRPLRIRDLTIAEGEMVGISGPDAVAAEVLTNLVTGAVLPDEGTIRVFGTPTSEVRDPDQWLGVLDQFAILTDRAPLLDGFTLEQNIAIPLTLELDALSPQISARVAALASEVGLLPEMLGTAAGAAAPSTRFRARLARGLAPGPRLLVAEHPTASIPRGEVDELASALIRAARARSLAALVVTSDDRLARFLDRHLVLDQATGALKRPGILARFSRHD